jgi:hypothetical protein
MINHPYKVGHVTKELERRIRAESRQFILYGVLLFVGYVMVGTIEYGSLVQ